MAFENSVLDLTFEAGEDLSSDQYTFVIMTSTGTVRRPDSASEYAIGVLQNAPSSGQAAVVRLLGVTKLQVNTSLAIGAFVSPEYVSASDAGKGQTATDYKYARGILLEASGAEDDLVACLLFGPLPSALGDLALASGTMLVGNGSGVAISVTLSGDVTVTNSGVTAIGSGKVLNAMISDAQITTAKISDAQVTTAKISDAQITTAKISDGQVTSAKIAAGGVLTANISDAQVTTAKISDAQVTSAKIAIGGVLSANISDAQVTTAKISDAQVTYAKLDSECISSLLSNANSAYSSVAASTGASAGASASASDATSAVTSHTTSSAH